MSSSSSPLSGQITHQVVRFAPITAEQRELLIAQLTVLGYEGFEEQEDSLLAYIPAAAYHETSLKSIAEASGLPYQVEPVPATNWNALWESAFPPVVIDDYCAVRAPFHEPIAGVRYEILITPKMSFGTGHHATTAMMIRQMRNLPLQDAAVIDFGTGTGILAILAAGMGAVSVIAIDHDPLCQENAQENFQANGKNQIDFLLAGTMPNEIRADAVLANVNRNLILRELPAFATALHPGGHLLCSGLLVEDEEEVNVAARDEGLYPVVREQQGDWICLGFRKPR